MAKKEVLKGWKTNFVTNRLTLMYHTFFYKPCWKYRQVSKENMGLPHLGELFEYYHWKYIAGLMIILKVLWII